MTKAVKASLACLLTLSLSAPATAQQPQDPEKEAQRPSRERRRQAETDAAAREAATLALPDDEADVTYEQVLDKPDDIQLNYRYARAQIRNGEVKGAAATLERVLLVNPNLVRVRLLYALVLFRLDNLAEAETQLDLVLKSSLSPTLRAEAERYKKEVEKRTKKTRLSGHLSAGFQYDTNRNASPESGQRLFLNNPVAITGADQRRDDTSLLFMANVEGRRDLGFQAGHEAFVSLNYYRAEQTLVKTLNLAAYSVQAGAVYKHRAVNVTPLVLFDHVTLAQTTYLRTRGGALSLERKLDRRTSLALDLKAVYQDFARTAQVPTADERDGSQWEASLAVRRILSPRHRLGGGLAYSLKNASREYNAYKRSTASLNYSWLLGKGAFLLSSLAVNWDQYDQPDVAISRNLRRDSTFRVSSTLGAPLTIAHPKLKDLIGTFTYEYYHALSNIVNYEHINNKISALLTYKWELGL